MLSTLCMAWARFGHSSVARSKESAFSFMHPKCNFFGGQHKISFLGHFPPMFWVDWRPCSRFLYHLVILPFPPMFWVNGNGYKTLLENLIVLWNQKIKFLGIQNEHICNTLTKQKSEKGSEFTTPNNCIKCRHIDWYTFSGWFFLGLVGKKNN